MSTYRTLSTSDRRISKSSRPSANPNWIYSHVSQHSEEKIFRRFCISFRLQLLPRLFDSLHSCVHIPLHRLFVYIFVIAFFMHTSRVPVLVLRLRLLTNWMNLVNRLWLRFLFVKTEPHFDVSFSFKVFFLFPLPSSTDFSFLIDDLYRIKRELPSLTSWRRDSSYTVLEKLRSISDTVTCRGHRRPRFDDLSHFFVNLQGVFPLLIVRPRYHGFRVEGVRFSVCPSQLVYNWYIRVLFFCLLFRGFWYENITALRSFPLRFYQDTAFILASHNKIHDTHTTPTLYIVDRFLRSTNGGWWCNATVPSATSESETLAKQTHHDARDWVTKCRGRICA